MKSQESVPEKSVDSGTANRKTHASVGPSHGQTQLVDATLSMGTETATNQSSLSPPAKRMKESNDEQDTEWTNEEQGSEWNDFLPEHAHRDEIIKSLKEFHAQYSKDPLWDTKRRNERITSIETGLMMMLPNLKLSLNDANKISKAALPLLEPEEESASDKRMVAVNFAWDENMAHTLDLDDFAAEIEIVKQWHKKPEHAEYVAPMMPVIQSSGTGKSRVMKEFRDKKVDSRQVCRYILLTNAEFSDEEKKTLIGAKGYDDVYAVPKTENNAEAQEKARDCFRKFIQEQCNAAVKEAGHPIEKRPFAIFLFDEAQHMAQDNGFHIRVLRWILREKPHEKNMAANFKLVAVTAGTSSSLANFFPEKEVESTNSRRLTQTNSHYENGKQLYDPFMTFRTFGCLAYRGESPLTTEYRDCIQYGRPLFELIHRSISDSISSQQHAEIANKILLGESSWRDNLRSCLSVLGTRIQMGHTTASVVSEMVAKGYAYLTSFQHSEKGSGIQDIATFAFLPDPVCARLAMCLMHDGFNIGSLPQPTIHAKSSPTSSITGKSKTFWANKFRTIFSEGLCSTNVGEMGELACALYILFCGDVLRYQDDPTFEKFSVDLFSWLSLMNSGGKSRSAPQKNKGYSINCIQFFRYTFQKDLSFFATPEFLKNLYQKACGVYMPNNMKAVDLVLPCRIRAETKKSESKKDKTRESETKIDTTKTSKFDSSKVENTETFIPIFISVKTYGFLSPEEAKNFLSKSILALLEANIEKGLCILAIMGQDRSSQKTLTYPFSLDDVAEKYQRAPLDAANTYSTNADVIENEDEQATATDAETPEAMEGLTAINQSITEKNTKRIKERCSVKVEEAGSKLVPMIVAVHNDEFAIHEAIINNKNRSRLHLADILSMHSEILHQEGDVKIPGSYRRREQEIFEATYGAVPKHKKRTEKKRNKIDCQ